jgi:hypothetical protein
MNPRARTRVPVTAAKVALRLLACHRIAAVHAVSELAIAMPLAMAPPSRVTALKGWSLDRL